MAVEIEFISSEVLADKNGIERIEYILDRMKKDKILVIEESLSSREEADLISATMEAVDEKFSGIEVSTLREKSLQGLRERIIRFLGGTTGGLTVIGPSKLVKKMKREPTQISVLADEKKK